MIHHAGTLHTPCDRLRWTATDAWGRFLLHTLPGNNPTSGTSFDKRNPSGDRTRSHTQEAGKREESRSSGEDGGEAYSRTTLRPTVWGPTGAEAPLICVPELHLV